MKPSASAQIRARRSGGVVGATSGIKARPAARSSAAISPPSSRGRSGTIAPAAPASASSRANAPGRGPGSCSRRPSGTTGRRAASRSQVASTDSSVAPPASARVPAAWITGPSASGSEYGTPSSTRSAPRFGVGGRHGIGGLRVREAAHQYGISAGAAVGLRGGEGRGDRFGRHPSFRRLGRTTSARSLSPRPLRVSHVVAVPRAAASSSQAIACEGLERRNDALEPRELANAARARVVGDGDVVNPAAVAKLGVLRPDPRVVEPRGHRVRLEDLTVVVGEHGGERTVEHAGAPGRERGSVAAAVEALTPASTPISSTSSSRNGTKVPIEFEPPPTHAITRAGSAPSAASACSRASSPITRCRSRTSAG